MANGTKPCRGRDAAAEWDAGRLFAAGHVGKEEFIQPVARLGVFELTAIVEMSVVLDHDHISCRSAQVAAVILAAWLRLYHRCA